MAKRTIRLAGPEDNPAAPAGRAGLAEQAPPRSGAQDRMPAALAAEIERLRAELAAARARIAQLEASADVDFMLDLLNRRGFERELRRALAYQRRYGTEAALIYLDLDGFKPVNDRHGHAAGDRMLQAVATTLRRMVRESDTVGRLGGDEFGVLLWNISPIQAAAKARELELAVSATVVMQGSTPLSVGSSAGFTMLGTADSPADAIARADLAMYARKRAGRAAAG